MPKSRVKAKAKAKAIARQSLKNIIKVVVNERKKRKTGKKKTKRQQQQQQQQQQPPQSIFINTGGGRGESQQLSSIEKLLSTAVLPYQQPQPQPPPPQQAPIQEQAEDLTELVTQEKERPKLTTEELREKRLKALNASTINIPSMNSLLKDIEKSPSSIAYSDYNWTPTESPERARVFFPLLSSPKQPEEPLLTGVEIETQTSPIPQTPIAEVETQTEEIQPQNILTDISVQTSPIISPALQQYSPQTQTELGVARMKEFIIENIAYAPLKEQPSRKHKKGISHTIRTLDQIKKFDTLSQLYQETKNNIQTEKPTRPDWLEGEEAKAMS